MLTRVEQALLRLRLRRTRPDRTLRGATYALCVLYLRRIRMPETGPTTDDLRTGLW